MTSPIIEIRGLKELQERISQYPQKLNAALKVTMEASMLTLHESVPPYPPPPPDSEYDRTGTLGRTLGAGMEGGNVGQPDVYDVKVLGSTMEGHFGTNLDYAPHVIGDDTQAEQNKHWWTMKNVAERASKKIEDLFNLMAEKLVKFLDGKGL